MFLLSKVIRTMFMINIQCLLKRRLLTNCLENWEFPYLSFWWPWICCAFVTHSLEIVILVMATFKQKSQFYGLLNLNQWLPCKIIFHVLMDKIQTQTKHTNYSLVRIVERNWKTSKSKIIRPTTIWWTIIWSFWHGGTYIALNIF